MLVHIFRPHRPLDCDEFRRDWLLDGIGVGRCRWFGCNFASSPTLEPECSGVDRYPEWPRATRFVWWLIAEGCKQDIQPSLRRMVPAKFSDTADTGTRSKSWCIGLMKIGYTTWWKGHLNGENVNNPFGLGRDTLLLGQTQLDPARRPMDHSLLAFSLCNKLKGSSVRCRSTRSRFLEPLFPQGVSLVFWNELCHFESLTSDHLSIRSTARLWIPRLFLFLIQFELQKIAWTSG